MSSASRGTTSSVIQPIPPDEVRRRYADILQPSHILALQVMFGLRAGVQGLNTTLARWLSPDALTPGRFQVLAVLWAAGRSVPQRDVVRALDVSRATVSALVEALQADGHVKVTPSLDDRRRVLIELTPAGRATILRLIKANAARLREAWGMLTDAELRSLLDTLSRLNAALER